MSPAASKPNDLQIKKGEDAKFISTITGKPKPEVEWSQGPVKYVTSPRVHTENTGNEHTLVLRKCQPEDTGPITVTATNKAGQAMNTAKLTVIGKIVS